MLHLSQYLLLYTFTYLVIELNDLLMTDLRDEYQRTPACQSVSMSDLTTRNLLQHQIVVERCGKVGMPLDQQIACPYYDTIYQICFLYYRVNMKLLHPATKSLIVICTFYLWILYLTFLFFYN